MGTIAEINARWQAIDFKQIVVDSIQETKEEMITLNQSQLLSGALSTGERIRPAYSSPIYAVKKNQQNALPPFLTPDLRLTGAFYAGIDVTLDKEAYTFNINSLDDKAPDLEAKYSPYIYGLSAGSKQIYASQTLQYVLFKNLQAALNK